MIVPIARWAFPLTGATPLRGGAHVPAGPVLAGTCLLLLAALGCAGGPKGADRSEGWYEPDSLQAFQTDTAHEYRTLPETEYVIGVGDKLDIVFLFHTNLTTRALVVRRDGRISLPYVGDQMAAGITPMTLDSVLTDRFAEILREPNISVIIIEPAPQKVFVLGEVARPGAFMVNEDVSMLQSVALAGGIIDGAMPRHAVLIRREGVAKIVGIEVDLQAVMDGSQMSNDIWLRNYDIVLIPEHPIYSAAEFIKEAMSIINAPLDIVFKGWQIANLSASYDFFRQTTNTP